MRLPGRRAVPHALTVFSFSTAFKRVFTKFEAKLKIGSLASIAVAGQIRIEIIKGIPGRNPQIFYQTISNFRGSSLVAGFSCIAG